ncbi:disulfide bond formation protein B [Glaciimonas sp. GG7]
MNHFASHAQRRNAELIGTSEILNIFALAGVSLALTIAFYYQLAHHDLPCPLCLLQRAGMIAIGIGFFMNIRFGIRSAHYGVALLGALITGSIAVRQVMMHIVPGRTNGYGTEVFGLHFYTWALLSSVAAVVFIAGMLVLKSWERPAEFKLRVSGLGKISIAIFTLLIAANLLSTVLQCGIGRCGSNPTVYELLELSVTK